MAEGPKKSRPFRIGFHLGARLLTRAALPRGADLIPAMAYVPTQLPMQYHRR